MSRELLIIKPDSGRSNERLDEILEYSLQDQSYNIVTTLEELQEAELAPYVLWAVDIGSTGINLELYRILDWVRSRSYCFSDTVGGILIDGSSELYTKSVGRSVVFTANRAGQAFPGRCLVEGPAALHNYVIQARNLGTDRIGAYRIAARTLIGDMHRYHKLHKRKEKPRLLILHASDHQTSNTLDLWERLKLRLDGCDFREINLREGEVMDCRGCSFEICRYFSEVGQCFYGGTITELVYPGVLECDAIIMLCPNYNDSISANLTAFVNRMTALFVSNRFYEKSLFGIVVSGYSGSEIIAEQLISGMNMNKTFSLPPDFALIETANEPGDTEAIAGLEERLDAFARRIKETLMI